MSPLRPAARAPRWIPTKIFQPTTVRRPTIYPGDVEQPRGIIFILVSGQPGSGIGQAAAQIVDELDERQIACETVSDEPFHRATFNCEFCRQQGRTTGCRDCPESLDCGPLVDTIRAAAQRVAASRHFGQAAAQELPTTAFMAAGWW